MEKLFAPIRRDNELFKIGSKESIEFWFIIIVLTHEAELTVPLAFAAGLSELPKAVFHTSGMEEKTGCKDFSDNELSSDVFERRVVGRKLGVRVGAGGAS